MYTLLTCCINNIELYELYAHVTHMLYYNIELYAHVTHTLYYNIELYVTRYSHVVL
jgi:hypothetical protein